LSARSQRAALRAAVLVFGCVPVFAGLGGILLGLGFIEEPGSVSQESHFRYLSGLLLGIGLGFWSTIPRIAHHQRRFGLLAAIVVLGGLARLGSLAADGIPNIPMVFGLVMELVVTPAMWLWQRRVAADQSATTRT
jgi:Domain of unknown function (DUF4345)